MTYNIDFINKVMHCAEYFVIPVTGARDAPARERCIKYNTRTRAHP